MATDLVYGINPAFETVLAGRRELRRALLSTAASSNPRLRKLVALLEQRRVRCDWAEKGRLIDLCQSHEHQGVVLETGPYPYVSAEDALGASRVVLLDNIEDPHNVGAILRTAEVLGYGAVLLPTRGVPPVLPSVVKASAGASEHLRICRDATAPAYVTMAQERGFAVVALAGDGPASLEEVDAAHLERLLLVCGGEDRGVGQFILNQARFVVRIPQRGRIGSLNASVAAGIALFALASTAAAVAASRAQTAES
jgi:23S rRNA (guanosine2251-2'-O)-methyltransferase